MLNLNEMCVMAYENAEKREAKDGDVADVMEYHIDNFSCIRITGANFVLKNVKTLNADFIMTELNTREVLE